MVSSEIARVTRARFFNLPPTAPMGGGTKLSEEAHLTGSIRAFVANQVNVAISRFLGYTVKSLNVPPRIGFDSESNVPP